MARPLPKKKYERNAAEQLVDKLGVDKNSFNKSHVDTLLELADLKRKHTMLVEQYARVEKFNEKKEEVFARYIFLRTMEIIVMAPDGVKHLKEEDLDNYLDEQLGSPFNTLSAKALLEMAKHLQLTKELAVARTVTDHIREHIDEHAKYMAKEKYGTHP